jgi:hypothetical protein
MHESGVVRVDFRATDVPGSGSTTWLRFAWSQRAEVGVRTLARRSVLLVRRSAYMRAVARRWCRTRHWHVAVCHSQRGKICGRGPKALSTRLMQWWCL